MSELSKNKAFYKNTVMLYVMTGAKYILPFVIAACLTRRLGPESYGVIAYLNTVMGFFLLLFDFGFNYSATKAISRHRDDPALIQEKIGQVMTAKCILVAVGFLVLVAITPWIAILRENFLLTCLFFCSQAAHIFLPDFLYRGLEKMEYITLRYVIAKLISAVLILWCIRSADDVLLIPIMYLLGTGAAIFYTLRSMRRVQGFRLTFAPVKRAMAEMKESAIYFASTFASTALGAFITFIMGVVSMPAADIAYWGVAFQVIQAIQSLYEPITSSLYPHVAKDYKNYKLVLRLTILLSGGVLLGGVALFFAAPLAVRIIAGDEFAPAAGLLRALIPVVVFSFPAQMLGFPLLGALGEQKKVTLSTAVSALFLVASSLLLIALGAFTLTNAAILRDASELLLALIRLVAAVGLIRAIRRRGV